MDKVKQFFELKELWKQSSEAERPTIDRKITELMSHMTDSEIEQLTVGVQNDFDKIHNEVADIKEQLSIREKLEPILPYLSVSNLSKKYFGKSSSWFYQRLNGNLVHGKVCKFSQEEVLVLEAALKDLCGKINSLRLT